MTGQAEGEGHQIASIDGLPPAPAVILIGTQLGENIGTTARAMLNFGLSDLRLVQPKCGWPNVKALKACSGAIEVLNGVRLYRNVDEATADLRLVLATTARPRDLPKPVVTAAEAGQDLRAAIADDSPAGVLFGPERTGLSNDDLLYADAVLSVPLNPGYSSLNLAQAVLLIAYEWFQAGEPEKLGPSSTQIRRPATKGELAGLVDHLAQELDRTNFFRTPDRRQSMLQSIKVVIQRAGLREPDVHLLRGMIKALAKVGRAAQGNG
ncbi:MAG: RNA methyltransferase [Geminicoccaceae bacterium]